MATQSRELDGSAPVDIVPADGATWPALTVGTQYTLQCLGKPIWIAEAADVASLPAHRHVLSVGQLFPLIVGSDSIYVDRVDRGAGSAYVVVTEAQ